LTFASFSEPLHLKQETFYVLIPLTLSLLTRLLIFLLVTASCLAAPKLTITPDKVDLDETVAVRVTGIKEGDHVVFTTWLADAANRWWTSEAEFVADKNGVVDLSKQAPISGSYSGVDPMGLFWSMSLPPQMTQRTAYWHGSLEPMEIFVKATLKEGIDLKHTLIRKVAPEDLMRKEVRSDGIRGTLLLPPSEKPLPAIIVLGGSAGGIPFDSYTAQFAKSGFASLGLAYFEEEGLPANLSEIPVEYFQKAIAWLRTQPEVDPERIGIVGTSIGGTAALLVAAHSPEVKAVASFNGGGVIFQSIDPNPELRRREQSSFSLKGVPLPFIPIQSPPLDTESLSTAYYLRVFLGSLFAAPQKIVDEATVPVERIGGPILLISGQADRLMGSATLNEIAYERLVFHAFPHAFHLLTFNGAGHNLGETGLPGTPSKLSQELMGASSIPYSFGGNPQDIASARITSWEKVLSFFHEALKPPKEESSSRPQPKSATKKSTDAKK